MPWQRSFLKTALTRLILLALLAIAADLYFIHTQSSSAAIAARIQTKCDAEATSTAAFKKCFNGELSALPPRLTAEMRVTSTLYASDPNYLTAFYHVYVMGLVKKTGDVATSKKFCDTVSTEFEAERPTIVDQCYHGLGHGFFSLYLQTPPTQDDIHSSEWTRAAITKARDSALVACGNPADANAHNTCLSGVFHSIALLSTNNGWYLNPKDPLWACEDLKGEYYDRCIGNINRLVVRLFPRHLPLAPILKYTEVTYSDPTIRKAVVRWWGQVNNTLPNAVAQCHGAGAYASDCLAGILQSDIEFGTPGKEYLAASAFCKNPELSPAEQTACTQESYAYFKNMYPIAELNSICKSLGPQFGQACKTGV